MPLPRRTERMELGLLAPALVVVAVPDPGAECLQAVARLRPKPIPGRPTLSRSRWIVPCSGVASRDVPVRNCPWESTVTSMFTS